ncbi:MAG: ATP-dependent DNA ligase [Candidatus Aenigmatarchaeota archaeon]
MRYSRLADYYERLEATTKKLEKRDILSELYGSSGDDLSRVVLLSMGIVFPAGDLELGVAKEMIKRTITKTYGISEKELDKKFKETGDLGLTAEFFSKNKRQSVLSRKDLDVEKVFDNLRKLPEISGAGSQEKKVSLIAELLSFASGKEAKYIVRTVLGEMRVGVAAGIVRDAIAKAFGKEPKEIEHVYNIIADYGKVAELAKKDRLDVEIVIGSPLRVMLAERAPDLKSALEAYFAPTTEYKYDGFRVQIHKQDGKIKLFSRRLEDVTNQFPDIVSLSKESIKAKNCIIEGEVLAIDRNGKPKPFQDLSRRIQRKYDIEKMVKEIPIQVNLFDLIYYDNESWMEKPLRERWKKLCEIVDEKKDFKLAENLETKDIKKAEEFYKRSLALGQEGVIVKNLDAAYKPGKRVGYWLKVKPIMEPLDLVIVGAEWGEGKRAKWLGTLVLAAKSGNEFLPTGMMGSGLTDEQLEEVTKRLKHLIIEEKGKGVKIKPNLVIEVGYEEIQKSTKYPTGYALRFPRLLRIREDRSKDDINTTKDIEKLFKLQK